MKKKILLILIAFILSTPVWAKVKEQKLEEVVLDVPQEETELSVPQSVSITEEKAPVEKSLKEKLQDVYHLEVYKYDKPTYLLQDVLTHKFDEDSAWDRTQLWAGYNGDIGLQFNEGSMHSEHTTNHYDINTINVGYDGFLKNNNGDFRIMFNFSPLSERNWVENLFADMYMVRSYCHS